MSDSQKVDFSSKHSLQNTWTLWFDNPRHKSNMKSWAENLKEIISINTVEEFWSTLNNIAKVSHLDLNSNYHFFKKGIFPQWEDEANVKGGKISIMLPKNKSDLINEYWLNILMAIIGEQLGNENEVCGVVVSVRKSNYRLSLWINTSEEEDVNRISEQLRQILNVPEDILSSFTAHDISTEIATASDANQEMLAKKLADAKLLRNGQAE